MKPRIMFRQLSLTLALLCCSSVLLHAARQPASEAEVQQFLKYYEYDKAVPLEAASGGKSDRGTFTVEGIRFTSVNSQSVPGYLFIPKTGASSWPCLCFLHGYGGSKDDSLMAARPFVLAGYAVFALDAQYHGQRKQAGKDIFSPDFVSDREAIVQTVVDWRRGIDYLETRPEIDKGRIGVLGVSMGGIMGGLLSGVDSRIKAAALLVAGGDWGTMMQTSQIPAAVKLRQALGNPDAALIAQMMDPVDPLHFVGRIAPRPLLMQNGKKDSIVPPPCSQALYDAAGDPKDIDWYDSDHLIPFAQVLPRVVAWVKKSL